MSLKVLNIKYKIENTIKNRILWQLEDGRKIIEKDRGIADQRVIRGVAEWLKAADCKSALI